MSKSLRLSEKWFHRGLWLVAFVFAGFLIGLGSSVVGDLPQVERRVELDDFIDRGAALPLRNTIGEAERAGQQAERDRQQAELKLVAAQQASRTARETFGNWIATRHATEQPEQDAELISRTKALDALRQKEDEAQRAVGATRQVALDARQAREQAQQKLTQHEDAARTRLEAENRRVELRVFGYRLALTLPLLVIAGWLFARKRKSTWWPFVWGFIFFALFAFFVELVPYLPSYGGYVRYAVGIVLTVLV
ncbi:MAG TPA: serine endopeptidase, partial [Variovorax sp.]